MSEQKLERQLNLLFILLNTKIPIEREEIRKRVPGYFGKSNEAFERMFERDKEDLRELGIPIEALPTDTFHEDNYGYLIREANWLLPEMSLTISERALLNLAAAVWSYSQLNPSQIGTALNTAVRRLSTQEDIEPNIQFALTTQAQHVEKIIQAKSNGKCVEFNYFSASSGTESLRIVAPWRIFLRRGRSDLIGFDQVKGEPRVFKISRIIGQITVSTEDAIEPTPIDLNAEQMLSSWQQGEENAIDLELKVPKDQAGELRLLATDIVYGEAFDLLQISNVLTEQIMPLLLRNCDVVKIVKPIDLINEINWRLTGTRS